MQSAGEGTRTQKASRHSKMKIVPPEKGHWKKFLGLLVPEAEIKYLAFKRLADKFVHGIEPDSDEKEDDEEQDFPQKSRS